jgi:hypothetical protein
MSKKTKSRSIPRAEAVRTVKDDNKGAAVKAAKHQNESLTSDGTRIKNVLENNGKSVSSHNKGGE